MRRIVFVLSISALLFIVACGSSSHTTSSTGTTSTPGGNPIAPSGGGSSNNVAPLIVDGGLGGTPNVAFTTVVVCAPGSTTNCATFDHISVDTASTGLRIPATAFPTVSNGAVVLAALQNVNTTAPVAECVSFLDNTFFWGTIRAADVYMGGASNTGEKAASVPIHVVGDTAFPVPSDCSPGGTETDTITQLGENGRLGVANLEYDCDVLGLTGFTQGSSNPCSSSSTAPPGMYYSCSSSSCSDSPAPSVALNQQVRNPVSLFATDNNGVILELPPVAVTGQAGVSAGQASLVFGIGTQSNNGLGSAVVFPLDSNINDPQWSGFTTIYNGVSYPNQSEDNTLEAQNSFTFGSFLDSGSNGIYFLDNATTKIPNCTFNVGFYCPTSTENLSAKNQAVNGNSDTVTFSVINGDSLAAGFNVFGGLAGPNMSGSQAADGFFDWGLPFFYGRNVYTAIWGVTPPSGVPAGPFWAY